MTFTVGSSFALGRVSTLNFPDGPSVATLTNGQIVSVWTEANVNAQPGVTDTDGVFGRILNPDGTQTSTIFQAHTTITDTQDQPSITALTGGGFVVTWTHRPNLNPSDFSQDVDVFAQIFDASGAKVGDEIDVFPDGSAGGPSALDDQDYARATALADGGFIVTWTDANGTKAKGQIFAEDGNAQGGAVDLFGAFGYAPAMPVQLSNGNVAVVAASTGVKVRLSSANLTDAPTGVSGATLPIIIDVSATGIAPSIAALPNGGMVVAYIVGAVLGVTLVNADGTLGTTTNITRPNSNVGAPAPQIAVRPDGSFGVVWQDKTTLSNVDIAFAEFGTDGVQIGTAVLINDNTSFTQKQADITVTNDGDYFVTYHSDEDFVNTDRLRGIIIDMADTGGSTGGGGGPTDPVLPTIDGKTLTGGGGKNTLKGSGKNDALDGGGGNDKLIGKTGDDILNGGDGKDKLVGGPGNDILNGDGGNDKIIGGPGNDTINGGAGKDVILAGPGDDVIIGGTEADRFVFQKNMGNDTVTDFEDDVDTIVLDNAIWGGTKKLNKVFNLFASVEGDDVVFDFGDHTLRIEGVNDLELLKNDVIIV